MPLEYIKIQLHTDTNHQEYNLSSNNLLDFLCASEEEKGLSRCVITSTSQQSKGNANEKFIQVEAVIASALEFKWDKFKDNFRTISSDEYYDRVNQKFLAGSKRMTRKKTSNMELQCTSEFSIDENSVEQLNVEICDYDMYVCKHMKR